MLFGFRCPVCRCVGHRLCHRCLDRLPHAGQIRPPEGIASARALLAYDADVQRLILAAKNGNRRDLLRWAADALIEREKIDGSDNGARFDVVSWIPASSAGRQKRGFDQGRVLARQVARRLDLPVQQLVARQRGEGQLGRKRVERLVGPTLRCIRSSPATVLVVDDVVTTGGSATAFAAAVRGAGAHQIHLLSAAAVGSLPADTVQFRDCRGGG